VLKAHSIAITDTVYIENVLCARRRLKSAATIKMFCVSCAERRRPRPSILHADFSKHLISIALRAQHCPVETERMLFHEKKGE
jgi:hypothetical protein